MIGQKIESIKSIITWTSNKKIIKNLTEYGLGKLYEAKEVTPIDYSSKEYCILDCSTFNFHLYPKDENEMKRIAEEINALRTKLIEEIKERSDVEVVVDSEEFSKKNIKDDKIYVSNGIGSGGNIIPLGNTRYSKAGANQLYRFITAKKNNTLYDLNFMRFFIDKDKKVNCILKAIQFDRCIGKAVNVSLDKDKICDICYPTSYRSQNNAWLEKTLRRREGKSFCFNPSVSFYRPKDIVTAFITFIDECDKQEKKIKCQK